MILKHSLFLWSIGLLYGSWFISGEAFCSSSNRQADELGLKCTAIYDAYNPAALLNPCSEDMRYEAPPLFTIVFATQYGKFAAQCERERAPVWADRVYNAARNGYYDENYFFRVIPGKFIQFGTNGNPAISNIYNWSSTSNPQCAILEPQPPYMPYCVASNKGSTCKEEDVQGLSNTYGTLSMSTSYASTKEYPNGVTWNATAELFINTGDNSALDANLFVPICTISNEGMQTVEQFPSFGEVSELGGSGPSLGMLYQDGNAYIMETNSTWANSMAITGNVFVCDESSSSHVSMFLASNFNWITLFASTVVALIVTT